MAIFTGSIVLNSVFTVTVGYNEIQKYGEVTEKIIRLLVSKQGVFVNIRPLIDGTATEFDILKESQDSGILCIEVRLSIKFSIVIVTFTPTDYVDDLELADIQYCMRTVYHELLQYCNDNNMKIRDIRYFGSKERTGSVRIKDEVIAIPYELGDILSAEYQNLASLKILDPILKDTHF